MQLTEYSFIRGSFLDLYRLLINHIEHCELISLHLEKPIEY